MANSKTWTKNFLRSFFGYLRDLFAYFLPLPRLPKWLRLALFGVDASFVFLVHPRRKTDVFIAWPFSKPFRFLLRKYFYAVLRFLPPTTLTQVKTPSGVCGIIVSSTWLPEDLVQNKKAALKEAVRCLRFSAKISKRGTYVGLGEWWPFLTRRGIALQKYSKKLDVYVTSGYCGTLCSLVLSIQEITRISRARMEDLNILVLGVGKMGSNVARALVSQVRSLTLYDKNAEKQERVAKELTLNTNGARKAKINLLESVDQLLFALQNNDVCICTTSNLRRILRPDQMPNRVLILDDSRPEALPRIYDKDRNIFVLEGGLLRIRGLSMQYDFGFGNDTSVFGCLAEAYIMAYDQGKSLTPTIGDVDFENYSRMLSSLARFSVEAAEFRSGQALVSTESISAYIQNKLKTRFSKIPTQTA